MRTIKASGKVHWAIDLEVTCGNCESVFAAESEADFTADTLNGSGVKMTCPECQHINHVSKPWIKVRDFQKARRMPAAETTVTVPSDQKTILINNDDPQGHKELGTLGRAHVISFSQEQIDSWNRVGATNRAPPKT